MAQPPRIIVVDYHKGNLSSVVRGLARAGATAEASDDPQVIRAADGVILPGVGSFYDAIAFMSEHGQDAAVLDAIAAGVPFLGICLGMQLLFDRGNEGVPSEGDVATVRSTQLSPSGEGLAPGTVFEADGAHWVRGLGLLRGSCERLDGSRLKVPHVGWDQVHLTPEGAASPLLTGFPEGANMYFTHSYVACDAETPKVLARTHYTQSFPCVVGQERVFGIQFHPEKSSGRGLEILKNFVGVVREAHAERGLAQ